MYVKGLSGDDDDDDDNSYFWVCIVIWPLCVLYLITSNSHNNPTIKDEELRKLKWFAQDHEANKGQSQDFYSFHYNIHLFFKTLKLYLLKESTFARGMNIFYIK